VRVTGRYGIFDVSGSACYALMLAARITLAHFEVSSAMSFPKSDGVPEITVKPNSAKRATNFWSASAALISLLKAGGYHAGRILWRTDAIPNVGLVPWHEVTHNRNVGERLPAYRRSDC
jgi:hypothetical protein